ncbi:hypothetical protein EsH8_V_000581 [Colletotrichum jinshuiense]
MRTNHGMSMAPPGMDGRTYHNGSHNVTPRLDWQQPQSQNLSADPSSRGMERASITNLRTSFRPNLPSNPTIRAVTPEYHHPDLSPNPPANATFDPTAPLRTTRGFTSTSPQTSPRSVPGDFSRRQGMVFNDTYGGNGSYDNNSTSPPMRQSSNFRPRTHTMDGALRQQFMNATAREGRQRVGSFSSSGSQPLYDDVHSPSAEGVVEVTDLESDLPGEIFRIEKTISLRVTEAKLKPRVSSPDNGFVDRQPKDTDPLVGNYLTEVILDGEVRARSTIKCGTKNPFWREDYQFADLPPTMPFLSIIMKRVDGNLESFSHHLQTSLGLPKGGSLTEVLCGSVDIPLDQVEPGKDFERWLEIYDERQQVVGTMLAKLHHEELVVLHSKEYQALSTLLHSFPSGLTAQIADALPGNLRRLSEIFLNIFQVSGHANEWLQTLVEDEIDGIGGTQNQMKKYRFSSRLKSNESMESSSDREQILRDMGKSLAGEANLLFRGNTLLTQALEFHMRRSGKEYLELMLQTKIFEINETNPNCEVDPSKLKPGENIQEHWTRLLQLTAEVWQCICKEPTKCPPELRSILKYIRAVAEDRYGDWLRTVTYTSVSGFLFLRFICPAILSPKLFGLLRDHPRPRAQRTLTLVAKALQALGNLSTFGKKEEWMEPMNKFLGSNRQSVKDYIDTICSIPVERNKVALGPSYSTPIAILGRLSPTAREGFPALPHLIDHARNFAALVKMWTEANPIGNGDVTKPIGGEDDILIFNDMCIGLQERADLCYARMDGSLHETSSLPASEFADALDHGSAMLESMSLSTYHNNSPTNSASASTVWIEQDGFQPPGSAGSDVLVDAPPRRSREHRRGRDFSSLRQTYGHSEHASSHLATLKRNGRATRHILSGIMKPFGRSDSPESSPSVRGGKNFERSWNTGY